MVADGSDQKSDPCVVTHTTNGISATDTTNGTSTQKLIINPTIQSVVQPITPLVTIKVEVVQESLSPRQTSLLQTNGTDAPDYWNLIGTERDRATPIDNSSSKTRSRATCQSPTLVAISVSPSRIGNQYVFSPSNPSTERRGRNTNPFDASINGFLAVNETYVSNFSGVSSVETVSTEVADVNPREKMNFASNSVFSETPKFVDLGISPPPQS